MGAYCHYDSAVSENQSACGIFADTVSFVGDVCRIPDIYGIYFKLIKLQTAEK